MILMLGSCLFPYGRNARSMKERKEELRDASEKPDSSRLPKLPARGRKVYDLNSEEIEALLISEDVDVSHSL